MATSSDELQVIKRKAGPNNGTARSYRIIEVLGRGGFGTVYRAELLGSSGFTKQVALKVLHNVAAPDEIVVRFRDEARILGLIQHRAIVKVDSLAHLESGWAVVMEYVPGVNVSALVKYGPTPPRAALNLIEEVASALYAAHDLPSVNGEPLHLIHRDIKPMNLRLSVQGEVKVLDFGVARAEFGGREAQTEALRFGSARYMSPERADGIEGPFIDVYSLGVVLAELLAGQRFTEPPKNPERYAEWLNGLMGAMHARMATNTALTPENAEKVVKYTSRMLAFEVAQRPTARDVERESRQLASEVGGPWLREWAEAKMPILLARSTTKNDDPITGSILIEVAGPVGVHGLESDTKDLLSEVPAPARTARPASRAGVGVAAMAAAALGLMLILVVGIVASGALGRGIPVFIRVPLGQTSAEPALPASPALVEPAAVDPATPEPTPTVPTDPALPDATVDPIVPPTTTPGDAAGNTNAEVRRREEAARKQAEARAAEAVRAQARAEEDARRAAEAERSAHTATINGIEFDTLTRGVVVVDGDADSVVLVDSAGARHPPGALPPGRYDVLATFSGQEIPATSVVVTVGNAVKVKCAATMMVCSRQ